MKKIDQKFLKLWENKKNKKLVEINFPLCILVYVSCFMTQFKRKNALFLSVELMIFLIVLIVILAMIAAGIPMMSQMYRVKILVRDIADLRTAVGVFTDSYGKFPGDFDSRAVSGGRMSSDVLSADMDALAGTSAAVNDRTMGSGVVSIMKNPIAYKQLAMDQYKNDLNVDLQKLATYTGTGANNLKTFAADHHISSPIRNSVWVFSVDSSNTTATIQGSVLASSVYAAEYNKTWASNFKATLISLTDYVQAGALPIVDVSATSKIAAISPSDIISLESKMDDGTPYAIYSTDSTYNTISGEGMGTLATTNGCTTLNVAAPVLADLTSAKYQDSKVRTTTKGCVLHVLLSGAGIQEVSSN